MNNTNKTKKTSTNNASLKKLLATASAFAMIAGASSGASATLYKANNPLEDVILEVGVDPEGVLKTTKNKTIQAWKANDSLYFDTAVPLTLGSNGNAGSVATLDLNNKTSVNILGGGENILITIAEDSTVGSIIDSTGGQKTDIIVNDGKTLTFGDVTGVNKDDAGVKAGQYGAIQSIMLGSNDGVETTLEINVATKLSCTIDTKANTNGVVGGDININAATTFNGELGEQKALGTITSGLPTA